MGDNVTDIAAFLLARIDETKKKARSYRLKPNAPGFGETWHDGDPDAPHGWWNYNTDAQRAVTAEEWHAWTEAWTEAVTDPFVLADCESKRRLVELHGTDDPELTEWEIEAGFAEDAPRLCRTCHDYDRHDGVRYPCPTLRLLALPYAAHLDFDPSWGTA